MAVSWNASGEADHFLVSVTADNGGIMNSCNTTTTACSISNVTCGKMFTVRVTSVRGACRSRHTQIHSIPSGMGSSSAAHPCLNPSIHPATYLPLMYFLAPCQPQGIRGRLDCVANSAWISWNATDGADSYFVSAVGGEDRIANCSTSSNTTCEVEDLACGVLYNFSVIAKNSKCESQPSATIGLQTGNRFLTLRKRYADDFRLIQNDVHLH